MTFQAGGRITITIGGTRYSPRGKAVIDPAQVEHTINENSDGKVSRSTKARAAKAEITLDRGNTTNGTQRPQWDVNFMMPFYDISIAEIDTNVLHVFTGATLVGTPKIDTETGEVSGLSIATDSYLQTNYQ